MLNFCFGGFELRWGISAANSGRFCVVMHNPWGSLLAVLLHQEPVSAVMAVTQCDVCSVLDGALAQRGGQ